MFALDQGRKEEMDVEHTRKVDVFHGVNVESFSLEKT